MVHFSLDKYSKYNIKNGALELQSKETKQNIKLAMLMAYMIKTNKNKEIIEIKLDNEEDIVINII